MFSQLTLDKCVWFRLLSVVLLVGMLGAVVSAQCLKPGFNFGKSIYPNLDYILPTAALDLNGDGNADVVLQNPTFISASKMAVLFGDGMGGFSAPVEYSLGQNVSSLVFGDLNNDNRPDMIVHYNQVANSKIFWNNGAGAFPTSMDLANTFGVPNLVVDVNGDSKGDVFCVSSSNFTVRLGDGAGSFSAGTPVFFAPWVSSIYGVMPGDFNNDTTMDLAVSYISSNVGSKLIVYSGDGSGGFVAGPEISIAGDHVSLTETGDFNGDGKPDLAGDNSLSQSVPDAVTVLLNNGAGGFTQTDYPVLPDIKYFRKGDFNGDGKLDLATETRSAADFFGTGTGTFLDGNGMGGFTRRDQIKSRVNLLVVADFNNDSKTDGLTFLFDTQSEFAPDFLRTMLGTCARRNITSVVDYDGDGITDYALWRPSDGRWFLRYSAGGIRIQPWGLPTDIPVPGDYDGDDKTDIAVFRPSDGGWYIIRSTDNLMIGFQWGANGDKPAQGDFDGDGIFDLAIFRPSEGIWYIRRSSDGSFYGRQFGTNGDKPVQADFDGDNKMDIAVYRPSTGIWYGVRSSDDSVFGVSFGILEDKPVQGDYDGDGKAEIAVYRPSTGIWYVLMSRDSSVGVFAWGQSPDRPAPGDFVGRDLMINLTVRRDSNSSFYTYDRQSVGIPVVWGATGDAPVSTPYTIE